MYIKDLICLNVYSFMVLGLDLVYSIFLINFKFKIFNE